MFKGGIARYRIADQLKYIFQGRTSKAQESNYHNDVGGNRIEAVSFSRIQNEVPLEIHEVPSLTTIPRNPINSINEDHNSPDYNPSLLSPNDIYCGDLRLGIEHGNEDKNMIFIIPREESKEYLPGNFIWNIFDINIILQLGQIPIYQKPDMPDYSECDELDQLYTGINRIINNPHVQMMQYDAPDDDGTQYRILEILDVGFIEEYTEQIDEVFGVDSYLTLRCRYQNMPDPNIKTY